MDATSPSPISSGDGPFGFNGNEIDFSLLLSGCGGIVSSVGLDGSGQVRDEGMHSNRQDFEHGLHFENLSSSTAPSPVRSLPAVATASSAYSSFEPFPSNNENLSPGNPFGTSSLDPALHSFNSSCLDSQPVPAATVEDLENYLGLSSKSNSNNPSSLSSLITTSPSLQEPTSLASSTTFSDCGADIPVLPSDAISFDISASTSGTSFESPNLSSLSNSSASSSFSSSSLKRPQESVEPSKKTLGRPPNDGKNAERNARTRQRRKEKKMEEERIASDNLALRSEVSTLKERLNQLELENQRLREGDYAKVELEKDEWERLAKRTIQLSKGKLELEKEKLDLMKENWDAETRKLKAENSSLKKINHDLSTIIAELRVRFLNYFQEVAKLN